MAYSSLARCVKDLETIGQLRRIEVELDPVLEIAAVQRRVFAAGGPALLFTNVRGTKFPMVANLYGTKKRLEYIFRNELPIIRRFYSRLGAKNSFFEHPLRSIASLFSLVGLFFQMGTRRVRPESAPVLAHVCEPSDLPGLVTWPNDGGPFITLPLVYSEDPLAPGIGHSNLGMYRIQMAGNDYGKNEMGLHYQIKRGLGVHHAHALAKGIALPVCVYVGGPPALTIAAIMPLPEGLSELRFAGLLGGEGVAIARSKYARLPLLAEADFCLQGQIGPVTKPEGPFGDHMGYYSLQHHFPVFHITKITHRTNALWPFTTVGRPPQEDTIFGEFIHELTAPFVSRVFPGIHEVHAVDASGVHPLLLAFGSERYTPYEAEKKPRELLTEALHLLGNTQTSLAKYLFIAAKEDAKGLSLRDEKAFFCHVLERTDFSQDLHFLPSFPCDTLDYTGTALHEGSKLIWAVCGEKKRQLGTELSEIPDLPFVRNVEIILPGVLILDGEPHAQARGVQDPKLFELVDAFAAAELGNLFPLMVLVDDCDFVVRHFSNFLWVTFTRSDPAVDCYGAHERVYAKKWFCEPPILIDARSKAFHPDPVQEDPATIKRIESLATRDGPLAGLW